MAKTPKPTWHQIKTTALREAALRAINDPDTDEAAARAAMAELTRTPTGDLLGRLADLPPALASDLRRVVQAIDAHFAGRSGSGESTSRATPTTTNKTD